MSDPFIGEIRPMPYLFAPQFFTFCDGQLMPISQNQALYAVIGPQFGGDGRTTMGIPNLKGRAPIGAGTGPGLSPHFIGQFSGSASVALTEQQLPSHDHTAHAAFAPSVDNAPNNQSYLGITLSAETGPIKGYAAPDANTVQMSPSALASAGGGQPHENRQPFLGLNFCMALEGLFPSRN
jgi:microcystin-dependent protein